MSTVAVLGEHALIQGYALVGALPVVAETAAQVRDAWSALPADVRIVILTPAAAAALAGARKVTLESRMSAVMPE